MMTRISFDGETRINFGGETLICFDDETRISFGGQTRINFDSEIWINFGGETRISFGDKITFGVSGLITFRSTITVGRKITFCGGTSQNRTSRFKALSGFHRRESESRRCQTGATIESASNF